MKCIKCDKEAEYIYLGMSFCKEHKDVKVKHYKDALSKAKRTVEGEEVK